MDFITFGYAVWIAGIIYCVDGLITWLRPIDHHKEFMERLINSE